MQNKEEEKRIREDFKNQFKNKILRISNHTPEAFDLIDDLKDFISQEIEKSYQKGREEMRDDLYESFRKEIKKSNEDAYLKGKQDIVGVSSIKINLEKYKQDTRLQILEEVEKVIREEQDKIAPLINKAFVLKDYKAEALMIYRNEGLETILQQLNKMKEK